MTTSTVLPFIVTGAVILVAIVDGRAARDHHRAAVRSSCDETRLPCLAAAAAGSTAACLTFSRPCSGHQTRAPA